MDVEGDATIALSFPTKEMARVVGNLDDFRGDLLFLGFDFLEAENVGLFQSNPREQAPLGGGPDSVDVPRSDLDGVKTSSRRR